MRLFVILICFLLTEPVLGKKPSKRKDYLVTIQTDFGVMRLILYDQTPKHKANFIKLTQEKFYNGLLFHRIIQNFMIQGGDPNSRTAQAEQMLGSGDVGYTIPAEFVPELFHKKGALAAARDNNPEKASSGCQFYVVQGRVWDDENFQKQTERITQLKGRQPTDAQKQVYQSLGGTPHLDGNYTVFGEVIDGLAVVDSVAKQPANPLNRPLKDLRMTVSGEWMKKKKITKQFGYTYRK
ncbi:peptidylprolyl isomerase [Larkinella punicea]|uniref:Peptidyl-prolyl cis-trans isomerase n=1 Tax=Larkinella punicea TaxID=2315727 RepID=A0A368JIL6_9BACT|nr:peptidylprolyl isomerase [Larkinella punicea]RCR67382.1 peptidylprolyl isomerase [Larkinella punicea]